MAKKNFFFDNHTIDIFLFVVATISFLVTTVVYKHTKLKSLVTSLALQQIKEVGTVSKQEHFSTLHNIECTCKIKWWTICMLIIMLLGIFVFIILNIITLKLFRGHLFSNAAKIMLSISDV